MNAVECLKNGGMPLIEMILDNAPSFAGCYFFGIDDYDSGDHSKTYEDCVSLKELKQIVDAFELVEWHGGLKYAKSYFERNSKQYPDHYAGWGALEKAIELVEKCSD